MRPAAKNCISFLLSMIPKTIWVNLVRCIKVEWYILMCGIHLLPHVTLMHVWVRIQVCVSLHTCVSLPISWFSVERLNDFVDVLWLMVMFVCNVHTAQNTLSKNDSTHSELIMGTMLHIPTIWRTHEFYHTRIFLRRYMSSKCARITSNTSAYYISFHQDHQYLHKKKCVFIESFKQFFKNQYNQRSS